MADSAYGACGGVSQSCQRNMVSARARRWDISIPDTSSATPNRIARQLVGRPPRTAGVVNSAYRSRNRTCWSGVSGAVRSTSSTVRRNWQYAENRPMAPPSRGASPFLNAVWILAETEVVAGGPLRSSGPAGSVSAWSRPFPDRIVHYCSRTRRGPRRNCLKRLVRPARLAPARFEPKTRSGVTEECRRNQPNGRDRCAFPTTRPRSLRAAGEKRRG